MKKLFISQPMKDLPPDEILAARKKAIESAERVIGEPVDVLDTYFPEGMGHPLKYLAKSIEILAEADVAYFAKGWQEARGCRIENECAIQYGILTIEDYK